MKIGNRAQGRKRESRPVALAQRQQVLAQSLVVLGDSPLERVPGLGEQVGPAVVGPGPVLEVAGGVVGGARLRLRLGPQLGVTSVARVEPLAGRGVLLQVGGAFAGAEAREARPSVERGVGAVATGAFLGLE